MSDSMPHEPLLRPVADGDGRGRGNIGKGGVAGDLFRRRSLLARGEGFPEGCILAHPPPGGPGRLIILGWEAAAIYLR